MGAGRLRRLRPEGDPVAFLCEAEGASSVRSIRTTGKMTTAAETFSVGVSHELRRTRGNIMTAPIAPPAALRNPGVISPCRGRGERRAINALHG
jgi:hypothetical protein